jgi:hypothetical protein
LIEAASRRARAAPSGSETLAGNAAITAERHYTGVITPTGNGTLSLSRGPSTFNVAGDTARVDLTEEGFDRVTDPSTGNQVEFRRKVNDIRNYSPAISASWALDKGPTDSANLNLRYHFDHFLLRQVNHVIPTGAPEHDDTLVEDYPTKIFEAGGDVTRPLAGGAIKFVALASRQRRHTLDESDIGNLGHTEVVGGFQQLSNSQRNESIGRLTWSDPKLLGFQFESGAEVAWNTLDFNLNLFTFDESGAKTRVDLPLDNARVTELRGEFWINGSRPLSKTLRMDLGLNYEMSRLQVSGDATADRKLNSPNRALPWTGSRGTAGTPSSSFAAPSHSSTFSISSAWPTSPATRSAAAMPTSSRSGAGKAASRSSIRCSARVRRGSSSATISSACSRIAS